MRKWIIAGLMAATVAPTAAWADSPRAHRTDIRDARRDVREERRDLQEARRDLHREQRDARNDWRAYRQRNRNVYRMPAYAGPQGYRHRVINRGYTLARPYYVQRYWIADPYRYRLPRVRGHDRWVRYGNDVLLVDTRSGRVQDVIRNFFW